jgi:NTP pyrophosphatase (non-canonical NTP hydrolase)
MLQTSQRETARRCSAATGYTAVVQALEARTLEVQLTHFKIPPEQRGRLFYALELVGEMGELLNGCKKYLRTTMTDRRAAHVREHIPDEAADTFIAAMLLKLAARDTRRARPRVPVAQRIPRGTARWLHRQLSGLAGAAVALYAAEVRDGTARVALPTYSALISGLLRIAAFFDFDLAVATETKLATIVKKVAAGYYD